MVNTFSPDRAQVFPTGLGLLPPLYFLPTSCLVPYLCHCAYNTLLLQWEMNPFGTEVGWKPNITDIPGRFILLQVL